MKKLSFIAMFSIIVTLSSTIAMGAISTWLHSTKSGNWTDPNIWQNTNDPYDYMLPNITRAADVVSGHAIDVSTTASAGRLNVGNAWYPGTGVFNVKTGANLTLEGDYSNGVGLSVGYYSNNLDPNRKAVGIMNISGGLVTSKPYTFIGDHQTGILNISGGALKGQSTGYGHLMMPYQGNAYVYQTGGEVNMPAYFYMLGTYWQAGDYSGDPNRAWTKKTMWTAKYFISGNSKLIFRNGYHEIGHYGNTEFRVIGSKPFISFKGVELYIHAGGDYSDPNYQIGDCVMGFDIDANGVSPIRANVQRMKIGPGTIFDISGGKNGLSYLLIDATSAPPVFPGIDIDVNNIVLTHPSQYSLRKSTNGKQLYVDVIAPVCSEYLVADFNYDCIVNTKDLNDFADKWLINTTPQ